MKIHEEKSNKKLYLHIGLVLVLCVFHLGRFGVRPLTEKSWFYNLFVEITGPMSSVMSLARSNATDFRQNYFDLVDVNKENSDLNLEIAELKQQIFELSSLKQENSRLKNLLNFTEGLARQKVLARVISWDTTNRYEKLRINKGLNQGVTKNSIVINAHGLIGKVINVSANYSDISTILDFQSKVDVMFEVTRSHGVLEGISDELTSIKYVKNSDDIQINEIILTSGLGNIFPKGIKVGAITSVVAQEHDLTKEVKAKPFVDFSRLEEVVVLLNESDLE